MKIEIEIPEEDANLIDQWLSRQELSESNSHGTLDIRDLARMLLEDVAYAVKRPGSWEGANMIEVLRGHGYW